MLSWDRLRVFAAVAEHGSVHAAAESLHITGPAVSQHLRKLEREVASRLVEPNGRGIRLTHAGRLLAVSAREMVAAAARAEADLADLDGLVAGPLRIGAVASALRCLVPQALKALTTGHPRLAPEVHDGEAVQMLPALCNGELDVVVLESWTHCPTPIPKGVQVKRVLHEHALLAVPADHPHANLKSANLADLQDQLWATCPPDTDTYEALVQLLRTNDHHEIDIRYYVADGATQLRLVAAGLAVALIPEMVATPTPPGVTLLPCEPAATRNILAATKKADETPQARAFTRELRETARAT
ncbi:LysR family transcriptional regulator [Saccharopolyspora sp. ASAGF58]|uniref:LysR family transcriptional regulator n=1 Tax=Saccharopolyspora sp. ASAGF58 TaxID=2719023 RepID=UPI00143FF0BF|nr:LysR family transcriptional regulator [Saccharopolyspora sp. ASAGF58]QIZ33945.1 LysR family transcriptional regulator [Saccharopolyspora sp. ASAGF58]